jgi:hypothetical protein
MFDVPDMNTEILECITMNTSACPPCKSFEDCMEHLAVIRASLPRCSAEFQFLFIEVLPPLQNIVCFEKLN